jgi:hypothetical protein
MSKILEAAARRPCPTCEGHCELPPINIYEPDPVPCPDCQDSSGQPTGLWLPELTVECSLRRNTSFNQYLYAVHSVTVTSVGHDEANCDNCNSTSRVLSLTSDNIDAAMERLEYIDSCSYKIRTAGQYEQTYTGIGQYQYGQGATREAARIAAAEAVVKAVWSEVKHE